MVELLPGGFWGFDPDEDVAQEDGGDVIDQPAGFGVFYLIDWNTWATYWPNSRAEAYFWFNFQSVLSLSIWDNLKDAFNGHNKASRYFMSK